MSDLTLAEIGALAAVAGVGVAIWYGRKSGQASTPATEEVAAGAARDLAKALLLAQQQQGKLQGEHSQALESLADKDQRIRELTQAVETLRNTNAVSEAQRKDAEVALAGGDTAKADAIFAAMEQADPDQTVRAAKARGAIAYQNQPCEALQHYQRAVAFASEDAEAWNRIGALSWRLGDMAAAAVAWERTQELGQIAGDKEIVAAALGNLGIIAKTRGELASAERFYRRALELNEVLSRKEGMATNLNNLGVLAETRG